MRFQVSHKYHHVPKRNLNTTVLILMTFINNNKNRCSWQFLEQNQQTRSVPIFCRGKTKEKVKEREREREQFLEQNQHTRSVPTVLSRKNKTEREIGREREQFLEQIQ